MPARHDIIEIDSEVAENSLDTGPCSVGHCVGSATNLAYGGVHRSP
jgi:hypothetical protein